MTTRLAGEETYFLPFNRGHDDGAKGNPANPAGAATSYLWEEVLERHTWLNILGALMFLHEETDEDPVTGKIKRKKTLMFPRYHQWRAVRKIVTAIRAEGTGRRYLIEHSAGSGKTNTIAWTAHRLTRLHDQDNRKVFDKVLIVSLPAFSSVRESLGRRPAGRPARSTRGRTDDGAARPVDRALSQPYEAAAQRDCAGPAERSDQRVARLAGAREPGDVVAEYRGPCPRAVLPRYGAAGPAPVGPRLTAGQQPQALSGALDHPYGRRRRSRPRAASAAWAAAWRAWRHDPLRPLWRRASAGKASAWCQSWQR